VHPKSTTGIVDANAFYCSCFAAFNAKLADRPVVVLSNNDGNVIARNPLAKALGIGMGQAFFEIRNLVAAYEVAVFSSNHPFFGEMSARFQRLLYDYSPLVEHYSVDECFIDLQPTSRMTVAAIAREIRRRIHKLSGVPVSVGVAKTKTLAKAALHHAKTSAKTRGVLDLTDSKHLPLALQRLPVGEVWNIGPARAELLQRNEINNALELSQLPDRWVRQHLTVVGLRTVQELRGVVCYPINPAPLIRQQATCSRAFGTATESLADVRAAVAHFTAIAAAKLRREGLLCGRLSVWITTDGWNDKVPQYSNSQTFSVAPLSNCTLELAHLALLSLAEPRGIFRPGYAYKRAGVSLDLLEPEATAPLRLFADDRYETLRRLMLALDYCNARFGAGAVQVGLFPSSALWRTRAAHPAPGFTTRWGDVMLAG
jgi:DNA polymerase V